MATTEGAANLTSPSAELNICALVTPHLLARLDLYNDPFFREPNTRVFVTALYTTVACIGAIGSLFVIAAVVRNPQMRTPRNYFIINLALSDLLMCTLTVPFTLYYVLNTFWGLGSTSCRIVASAQGVNIFVSAMSITAIGLDRYWVILFPTKTQQQRLVVVFCFTFIWIFSFLLAFPLFYATDIQYPRGLEDFAQCGVHRLVCSENWTQMVFDKRVYTISSTAFQYVLPLTMLTFVYARIIWRLENRMVYRQRAIVNVPQLDPSTMGTGGSTITNNRLQNRRRSLEVRQRRMNLLLICVVAFFAFCWLPLNVYNALLSFEVVAYNVVAFASCHVFGMMSACANPILYGVFNENFRQEFIAILACLRLMPVVRLLRKLTVNRRNSIVNGQNETMDGNGVVSQQPTSLRSSIKRSKTGHSRKTSGRGNRLAPDGFQKLLDTSHLTVTANGSCYNNLSSATATNCYTSSPPSIHVDEFEAGRGGSGGSGESVTLDPTTLPFKKKLDSLAMTLEEKIPLFSDSGCPSSDRETEGSRPRSYVIVTDV